MAKEFDPKTVWRCRVYDAMFCDLCPKIHRLQCQCEHMDCINFFNKFHYFIIRNETENIRSLFNETWESISSKDLKSGQIEINCLQHNFDLYDVAWNFKCTGLYDMLLTDDAINKIYFQISNSSYFVKHLLETDKMDELKRFVEAKYDPRSIPSIFISLFKWVMLISNPHEFQQKEKIEIIISHMKELAKLNTSSQYELINECAKIYAISIFSKGFSKRQPALRDILLNSKGHVQKYDISLLRNLAAYLQTNDLSIFLNWLEVNEFLNLTDIALCSSLV